jgi:hypothetical protein
MTARASTLAEQPARDSRAMKPRLGFPGAGWIGRNRFDAIADSARSPAEDAARNHPHALVLDSFNDLMEVGVDGVILATPSALHAEQAVSALERGISVFYPSLREIRGDDASAEETVPGSSDVIHLQSSTA